MSSVCDGESTLVHPDPFAQRVRALHEAWLERREVRAFAGSHTREAQLELLLALHRWAEGAVRDIGAVYGPELVAELGRVPKREDPSPAFTVSLAGNHVLTLSLLERRRMNVQHWYVSVSYSSTVDGGEGVMAGPERRNGQWTRSRLEDLLLSILGGYERSVTEGGRGDGPGHGLGQQSTARRYRDASARPHSA